MDISLPRVLSFIFILILATSCSKFTGHSNNTEISCSELNSVTPATVQIINSGVFIEDDLLSGYYLADNEYTFDDSIVSDSRAALTIRQRLDNEISSEAAIVIISVYKSDVEALQQYERSDAILGADSRSRNKVGENSFLFNLETGIPEYPYTSYLWFQRCNFEVSIGMFITDGEEIIEYANRLDKRLKLLCCRSDQ